MIILQRSKENSDDWRLLRIMIEEQSIKTFLDSLASDSPTPGGGTAAALSAAMSCSLMAMALRVSQKKVQDPLMEETAEKLDTFRHELLILADKDAEAFEAYMAARRLPKDTENERQERKNAMTKALIQATQVPLSTMQTIENAVEAVNGTVAEKVLPSVASDLFSGIKLAEAAMQCAFANVKINSTKDETQPLYEEALTLLNKFEEVVTKLEQTAKSLLGI